MQKCACSHFHIRLQYVKLICQPNNTVCPYLVDLFDWRRASFLLLLQNKKPADGLQTDSGHRVHSSHWAHERRRPSRVSSGWARLTSPFAASNINDRGSWSQVPEGLLLVFKKFAPKTSKTKVNFTFYSVLSLQSQCLSLWIQIYDNQLHGSLLITVFFCWFQ